MDTFHDLYSHFSLELYSTGNLSQSFIDTFFVGSWPWCQKWVPIRWKERFLRPFVQESRQAAHRTLTKAFLQAAATAAMHCQPERFTHPPPPVPPFLLAQNLTSKRIVPTDNMWPKSDDAKRHHQLLKSYSENKIAHKQPINNINENCGDKLRQMKTYCRLGCHHGC